MKVSLISPSQVVTELNARISWPAVAGAVSVYAGWTVSPTATLNTLTVYGAAAGSHDQSLPEGSVHYAHVVAVDGVGNQREYSVGPFYFDSAQTPDAIADLNHEDWVTSGGKQVVRVKREAPLRVQPTFRRVALPVVQA